MPNGKAWVGCAFTTLALAITGCQQTNDRSSLDQPSETGPTAVTDNQAAFASIEVATEAIQPHMAIGGNGEIYIAFIQRGNISVSISHDRGNSFSQPVVAIDVQGRARGGAHRGPRIGVDNDGVITVSAPVTFDDSEYQKRYPTADLYVVRSTDDGQTWSDPRQVNEIAKQAPEALHWMVVAPSGEVHVAWLDRRDRTQAGQDIFYTTVVDGEVNPNTKIASTVCECCAPGLAVDAAGNPFVAYREGGDKSSREIFARRSTNGGRTFSEARQINQQPTQEKG